MKNNAYLIQKSVKTTTTGARARVVLGELAALRAVRIARPIGRGWINKQLACIAPDERARVWQDRTDEAVSVSRCEHLKLAAYGVVILAAPLPACVALVARGMTHGRTDNLALAVLGRGRRDPLPGSPWHRAGAGIVWPAAARAACRAMGKSYRGSQRASAEVAAGWSISGNLSESVASMAARGERSAPVRRAEAVRAIRSALAQNLRAARAGVVNARFDAMQASTPKERALAGGKIGAARTALKSARAAVSHISSALSGRGLTEETVAAWFADNETLTNAGEKFCQRFRDANQHHACVVRPPLRKTAKA